MTSLIDVSLVLVVVLLVATPLAFQSSILVRSALESGREAAEEVRSERVEITVLGEDSVLVNRDRIARSGLRDRLAPLLAESASKTVVVRCDRRVSHGTFVEVLDTAKSGGAARIAVVGG